MFRRLYLEFTTTFLYLICRISKRFCYCLHPFGSKRGLFTFSRNLVNSLIKVSFGMDHLYLQLGRLPCASCCASLCIATFTGGSTCMILVGMLENIIYVLDSSAYIIFSSACIMEFYNASRCIMET